MSTILEALRRAEQERHRGKVPSLHAPSSALAVPLPPSLSDSQRASRWLWGGAAFALAGAVAVVLWWLQRPEPPRPATAAATPVAVAPVAAVAAPPELPAPAVPAEEPPRAAERSAQTPSPPHKRAQPPAAAAAKARKTEAKPDKPAAKTAPAPAGEPASAPVFAAADLPASVRADLPRLHLAGITWSANARLRMAIVNGQVLHEGDSAVAGLVLERIEPGRTIWAFRGYRIALASE